MSACPHACSSVAASPDRARTGGPSLDAPMGASHMSGMPGSAQTRSCHMHVLQGLRLPDDARQPIAFIVRHRLGPLCEDEGLKGEHVGDGEGGDEGPPRGAVERRREVRAVTLQRRSCKGFSFGSMIASTLRGSSLAGERCTDIQN